jgi:hypothetical protein
MFVAAMIQNDRIQNFVVQRIDFFSSKFFLTQI